MRITEELPRVSPDHRHYCTDDGRRYWVARLVPFDKREERTFALYQRNSARRGIPDDKFGFTNQVGFDFRAEHWGIAERIAFKMIRQHKGQIVLDAIQEL